MEPNNKDDSMLVFMGEIKQFMKDIRHSLTKVSDGATKRMDKLEVALEAERTKRENLDKKVTRNTVICTIVAALIIAALKAEFL
ncbi:MAG: hypothetical protein K0U41_03745 [Gammaproteobacteria bacterium]|nr:hypothetical protein [Gammaproteobacteria bacterium]